MRKQDIKPGVVYAYREGKYSSASPVVFLAAPVTSKIYTQSGRRYEGDEPYFGLANGKPGRHAGYPVLMVADEDRIPEAADVTLADFEAATKPAAPGGRFTYVGNLTYIVGPYVEEREERERTARAEQESRARAIGILTALRARDITPNRIPSWGAVDSVSLPLAEAEKLIALLNDREPTP